MNIEKIKAGQAAAFARAGDNAYFGNGFSAGVAFALTMLDNLPENMPLYRDSGLWQIRNDDMEEVVFQQGAEETFEKFIERVFYSTNKPENIKIRGA